MGQNIGRNVRALTQSSRNRRIAIAALVLAVLGAGVLAGLWYRHLGRGAPVIESSFPRANATGVPPDTDIQVNLDRPFRGSIDHVSLRLWGPSGNRVIGAIELHSSQTAVMLAPNTELAPGQYQAEMRVGEGKPYQWSFTVSAQQVPESPVGGPILVIKSEENRYSDYYSEILRAEGFTRFTTMTLEDLTKETLSTFKVAILTGGDLSPEQLSMVQDWIDAGGNLIAMRPAGALATLAGLGPLQRSVDNAYMGIDTSVAPGRGFGPETLQVHGTADIVAGLSDARSIASLYTDATTPASAPAVTLRELGNAGGEIAAYTFDLAKSVVLTRQGNPDWAGEERDGLEPIRPNDLFVGRVGVEPDFIDLKKLMIPQADEQMRLFSNLIAYLMRDTAPVPKFWYFPKGAKAVFVMAADDHGTKDSTERFFNRMLAAGPIGCNVAQWECARATSWMHTSSGLTDTKAALFVEHGFDIGSHVNTQCQNWSPYSLNRAFFEDLRTFQLLYPSAPWQQGSRLHCIVWSDYASQPKIEREWGIRYDMNYYLWPKIWVGRQAGFLTGSGLPMRYADEQGSLIDVFQQETHLVDEVWSGSFDAVSALVDRALGPQEYYGAFGTHFDFHDDFDVQIIDLATAKGIPMVDVQQMLDWTDGRYASSFDNVSWNDGHLSFDVDADERTAQMLDGMIPLEFEGERLSQVSLGDETVAFKTDTIKGVEYAMFPATTGSYVATYSPQ